MPAPTPTTSPGSPARLAYKSPSPSTTARAVCGASCGWGFAEESATEIKSAITGERYTTAEHEARMERLYGPIDPEPQTEETPK